jgi:DNA repair protein RecO (recombination protein O)
MLVKAILREDGLMSLYREEGVVLRTQKLGEADRIVTLLTASRGLLRVVAKGVRRTSSKFGARLEPFMVADLQLYEGRSLDTITQASTLGAYGPHISADYDRYRAANVMVETAERLSEGGPAPEQYRLLVGALRTLAQAKIAPELLRDGYLLRAIAAAGWAPGFHECVRCGAGGEHHHFVIQLGGLVCEHCRVPGAPMLESESVALLRSLLTGDWSSALGADDAARHQAAGIAAAYTQWHLERGIRSLRTQ